MKQRSKAMSWWTVKNKEELAKQLFDCITKIYDDQMGRRDMNVRCAQLYGNCPISTSGPTSANVLSFPALPENRVKINIISSMVDTVAAKISKMKPRVRFLTTKGDWFVQEKAKKLTQYVAGMFYNLDVYRLHQKMFKDSAIFDIGAIKHYRDGNRIVSERVLATELYVDEADAFYGTPTKLYQIKYVHKDILINEYPKHTYAIETAQSVLNTYDAQSSNADDYVVVVEAWLKSSKPGANDGRHVISISNQVLLDEGWAKTYFPFTFSRWSDTVVGFYGQSLAERLIGNQIEINKMLRIIQRSFHLGSTFKVFLEMGSKIAKEQLNNDIGALIYYNNQPPTYYTPQVIHPEYFQHLRYLIQSSYEEAGVSQLSASSKMPQGIDGGSGKALREYNDLETERFVLNAQQYEYSFLQTACQHIDLAREIYEDGEKMEVVAESKRFMDSIDWADIALENNQFISQMYPTSGLPSQPTGRLAYVQELINSGFIDATYGRSLLDFPDTEEYTTLKDAILDNIRRTCAAMLYKGEFDPPEPMQGLALGIEHMRLEYLRAKDDGAPEDRLDLVRRWIEQAEAMNRKAQEAATAQAQMAQPIPALEAPVDPNQEVPVQ